MDIKTKVINHNKRWNISVDADKQFIQLRNRVVGVIHQFLAQLIINDIKLDRQFKKELDYSLGEEIELERNNDISSILSLNTVQKNFQSSLIGTQNKRVFTDTHIYKEIKESKNIKQLATALQVVFWILEDKDKDLPLNKIVKELRDAAKLSPDTGFHITLIKKRVVFSPPGSKLLDEGIVNDVLEWLEKYPKVAKYFAEALKIYTDGDISKYRNLLDNLRFSIEQLLKEILGNSKSLENQKDDLLCWLDKRKKHQGIIKLYQQLLYHYCTYQNDAVKHNEAFSEDEIEFMIYLTGTFMRFLMQIV
ncbi:hypothetical protein [Chlorogloea sp. CCALA 695]|uniref:hypothetical protein n=1 Tax=Chlorogloea sp. CCALA 695 TaxID=2107693 RepID=UPI000D04DAA7|nr:hypothetical protein [Chlorogloea sp. CCALA 695]PSB28988.1 hypothetical protein C7B70_19530 [Chlorogloea sp. CCALA 695]